jgi:hypothetical protein
MQTLKELTSDWAGKARWKCRSRFNFAPPPELPVSSRAPELKNRNELACAELGFEQGPSQYFPLHRHRNWT